MKRPGKNNNVLLVTLVGSGSGLVYPIFADDLSTLLPLVNGLSIGTAAGFLLGAIEEYVLTPTKRGLPFPWLVGTKTILYAFLFCFVIVGIKGFNESVYYDQPFFSYLRSATFIDFLVYGDFKIILVYSMAMAGLVIFTKYMSRKLGQGVIYNFITGKYHSPMEEERIFMFIDIKSSTSIAEKLGAFRYYRLLNDFFFDITASVLEGQGSIYRYVGDQVTITWKLGNKIENARCIHTYFGIKASFRTLKERYFDRYEFVPSFRVSLHCGTVIHGEIGDVKSQIVFHGESLYETARIEKICGELDLPILVSGILKNKMEVPALTAFEAVETPLTRTDDLSFDLFTVQEEQM